MSHTHTHSSHTLTHCTHTVTITPSSPVLFENELLTVHCNSSVSFPTSVSWLRNGQSLSQTSPTLMINNVPLDWDNSLLTCSVAGDGNTTVELTVYCECVWCGVCMCKVWVCARCESVCVCPLLACSHKSLWLLILWKVVELIVQCHCIINSVGCVWCVWEYLRVVRVW